MGQEIELKQVGDELKKGLKKIASDENIQNLNTAFALLVDALLTSTSKDKDMIRLLIFIVAGLSAFLAAVRALT